MKQNTTKTQYVFDYVSVSSNATVVQQVMDDLKQKGWKDLRYSPNNRDCDCSADKVNGYRPMTEKELKDRNQWIITKNKEEIKELHRLAKKHEYVIRLNRRERI